MARLPVPIQRTLVEEAYLACAGLRIDGLPMFDSPACVGVSGTLCVRMARATSASQPFHARSRGRKYQGVHERH